jgi:hypothetical protein
MSKMKYYIIDPDNGDTIKVPDYMVDGVIKQYLDRKYTFSIAIGAFIIGFLCGVVASI